jgi:methionyl-tRNA synthetase
VWFDALANYLAADPARWRSSDDRTHVIGKGILRFHAVLWPAVLLSAGEPLPTRILVHEYLTSEGRKLSKSAGNVVDPFEVVERLGAEALRWWFVRDVARTSDTDFSIERVEARYAEDLAGGIGNLVRRIGTLARKLSLEPGPPADTGLAGRVDEAIEAFDLRGASGAIVEAVGEVNLLLELHRPWELLRTDRVAAQDAVSRARSLALEIVGELEPFLPSAVARLHSALDGGEAPFERVQPAPAARSIC